MSDEISSANFELSADDYMNPLYDRTPDEKVEQASEVKVQEKLSSLHLSSDKPKNGDTVLQKSNSNTTATRQTPERTNRIIPAATINCPEKIVICLDISSETEKPTFKSKVGEKFAPFKLIRRALGIFIHTKHRLSSAHQFALVLLRDNAVWVCDFTNSPEKIITIMNEMKDTSSCEQFDLTSLFNNIKVHAALPQAEQPDGCPPPYILRVLFVYGRSHCLPAFSNNESYKQLNASPHFFLDCYYIHEPPSQENLCEDIYNRLCNLDTKGTSYIFEVSRSPTKLYDSMAQLLAHPLQRPPQAELCHSIEPRSDHNTR